MIKPDEFAGAHATEHAQALRNNLVDAEIVVQDAKREVDDAVEKLRAAVQRRDMIARDLLMLESE